MAISFGETLHDGYHQSFDVDAIVADQKSPYQSIRIFDTPRHGRVMALDGIIQITSRDEFTYSEMLAHLPLFEHMARGTPASRVLIIGGGDGAIAEEVLKHKTVQEVVLAELDLDVIELCKEHFRDVHRGAFDDPRLTLEVGDAAEYLKRADVKGGFDVIIADRPDPVGPAGVLFGDPFYDHVNEALTPSGIAVFQNGVPFMQPGELADTLPQLQRSFDDAGVFLTVTPTYIGGAMALTYGSKTGPLGEVKTQVLEKLYGAIAIHTDYYSPTVHGAAFALPPFLQRIANGARLLPGEKPRIVASAE